MQQLFHLNCATESFNLSTKAPGSRPVSRGCALHGFFGRGWPCRTFCSLNFVKLGGGRGLLPGSSSESDGIIWQRPPPPCQQTWMCDSLVSHPRDSSSASAPQQPRCCDCPRDRVDKQSVHWVVGSVHPHALLRKGQVHHASLLRLHHVPSPSCQLAPITSCAHAAVCLFSQTYRPIRLSQVALRMPLPKVFQLLITS
jgi:hypothetical protein